MTARPHTEVMVLPAGVMALLVPLMPGVRTTLRETVGVSDPLLPENDVDVYAVALHVHFDVGGTHRAGDHVEIEGPSLRINGRSYDAESSCPERTIKLPSPGEGPDIEVRWHKMPARHRGTVPQSE